MRYADPIDVAAYADDHSDNVVQCRIYGHTWSPSSVTRAGAGFVVMQRCSRCLNRRSQEMDSQGYANAWRYHYQEGYLTEDVGRFDNHGRAVLRLAAIRHLTILDPDDEQEE